jgi:hypothetical protein
MTTLRSACLLITLVAIATTARAQSTGIRVTKARIGCLDIQKAGNLTPLVSRTCNGRERCSYKAPDGDAQKAADITARTRTFCTQAMEILYDCHDGLIRRAFVPGDAWAHPEAELRCPAAPTAPAPRATPLKGFLDCREGAADCNPCVRDVRGQFRSFAEGTANWRVRQWHFEWGKAYAPSSIQPYAAFDEDSNYANAFGVSYAHPQGFVRTSSTQHPFAGSHSAHDAGRPGTIFVVEQPERGPLRLASLHRTRTQHPSGVAALGRYVAYGETIEESDSKVTLLGLIDLSALSAAPIEHRLPELPRGTDARTWKKLGGGLAITKLRDGSYLLLSSLPGGREPGPHYHQLFTLVGDLARPEALRARFHSTHAYVAPAAWAGKDVQYSENASLITECRTGNVYAVHTSGDGEGIDALEGSGYFRLSQLEQRDASITLRPIAVWGTSQNAADCHLRSAATAGPRADGTLSLVCHQYRKDPDPSAVNPFSFNTSGRDAWNFREGVAR